VGGTLARLEYILNSHVVFSQMLEPAATMVPLVSVALEDRYLGPAPHTPYVVGIDAK
jgi:hypothetical protein